MAGGHCDGTADAIGVFAGHPGGEPVAQERCALHLPRRVGRSRTEGPLHDGADAVAVLFAAGHTHLQLRPNRTGDLGQEDTRRGPPGSGSADGSLQTQGYMLYFFVFYKYPLNNCVCCVVRQANELLEKLSRCRFDTKRVINKLTVLKRKAKSNTTLTALNKIPTLLLRRNSYSL